MLSVKVNDPQTLTCTYSLKRVNSELLVTFFCKEADLLLTLKFGVDDKKECDDDGDEVLDEARVCMQDSTTLDVVTSLVSPLACCFREFLDS